MLNATVINTLALIFLPFVLRQLMSFFKSKTNRVPYSRIDYLFVYILIGAIAFHVYGMFNPPTNIFYDLGLPLRSPSYQLRNALRDYFAENLDLTEERKKVLSNLYEKLKSTEYREFYATFGHDAFIGCSFCKIEPDYGMYILPEVLFSYWCMAGIVGLITSFKRKRHWRWYGLGWITIVCFVEIYAYMNANDWEFLYCDADYWRRIGFIGLLIILTVVDQSGLLTREEWFTKIANMNEQSMVEFKEVLMMQNVIMRNENLREQFVGWWAATETAFKTRSAQHKQEEARILGQMNAENVFQEVRDYAQTVLEK